MIIDGKKIAEEISQGIGDRVKGLGKVLRLAIIQIGSNPASEKFIAMKQKFGERIGVETRVYKIPDNVSTTTLRKKVAEVSHLKTNDGVIIQLPLPEQVNTQYILNGILPKKDVDALSSRTLGEFTVGRSPILPPVVGALKEILERNSIEVKGRNAAVLGAGKLVGLPVAIWLIQQGATVSILNEFTLNHKPYTLIADIVISGAGKPGILTADMVKDGVVIIDAGTSEQNGKLIGDVEPAVKDKASLFTPVPGGIGPITVAKVFENLIELNNTNR